jgi:N-acetyl-anhydromuramyl-L-alanine amidase AmpD
MPWYPDATKQPLKHHFVAGKMVHPIRGLVLHITATNQSLSSLFADFNSPNQTPPLRSAHFGVAKDGTIWQFADTNDVTFAVDGVWGGDGVDNHWVSVENVAVDGDALTDDQTDRLAQLFAWLIHTEAVPLTLAEKKTDRGLGYHRMFHIGDHSCPGDTVIAQRQGILDTCSAAYI